MIQFLWNVLTRFAKTVGCLFIVAGFVVAAGIFQQRIPMINAVRYRESRLLPERLSQFKFQYEESQRLVMQFKGAADFPSEYAAAAFNPQFPPRAVTARDFEETERQLFQAGGGRDAMKRFVVDRLDTLLSEIQQKLLAHAASLTPPPAQPAAPAPRSEFDALFDSELDRSTISARKSSLDDAKQFLGVLQSSAENAENQKKLGDSILEVEALAKLLPTRNDPSRPAPESREPLNAEKVASRLSETREGIKKAVLSSWALDEAFDRALQTLTGEQREFAGSDFRVKGLSERLYLQIAAAITVGCLIGIFFLLIGDWTKKASTVVLDYWCELFKDFSASPSDIYEAVERAVETRQIPGLECERVFWHEGGAISAKREYLQISRERLAFEISACQFGTGFFVSFRSSEVPLTIDPLGIFLVLGVTGLFLLLLVSLFGLLWGGVALVIGLCVTVFALRTAVARGLADVDRVLMKTPLFAPLYELFLRPRTYYRIDSTAMYLKAVHDAVAEAFQAAFGEQGVPLMSAGVSPPVMDALYKR